jgi:hypothetical protein
MARGCLTWKVTPGPCPVDDTPFTACTPASVAAGRHTVTVPVRRPRVLAQQEPPPPATSTAVEFTTATYRGQAKRRKR